MGNEVVDRFHSILSLGAEQAVALLKDAGTREVRLIAVVASPEGVARMEDRFPEVPVFTAGVRPGTR